MRRRVAFSGGSGGRDRMEGDVADMAQRRMSSGPRMLLLGLPGFRVTAAASTQLAILALFPPPASALPPLTTFSAGIAESKLNATEQTLLDNDAVGSAGGALTYFWITGGSPVAQAVIRMFVVGADTTGTAPGRRSVKLGLVIKGRLRLTIA